MAEMVSEKILEEEVLPFVQKPARYVGGEWQAAGKPEAEVETRVCLAFPDVYEVGMSHLGLKILYDIFNRIPGVLAERVYAPWFDMEERLRRLGLPLFSLETRRPLAAFDIVGFTLQYELSYTTILAMLDLGGITRESRRRGVEEPLVIGGGPCAFNPEPLAPFFDAFVLGEGEEVCGELVECWRAWRAAGEDRPALWRRLAQIEGVYVPTLYEVAYNPDGTVAAITPHEGAPATVRKRVLRQLAGAPYPEAWLVPSTEVIHDRLMLEIMRGCTRGCRFCQAGMIYRPVRERSLPELVDLARRLLSRSGYEELSLASLSSADYSRITELMQTLLSLYGERGIAISLPSLRVDSFAVALAEAMQGARKTGLTFAPEAGTQRLRDVINKNVTEADLLRTAQAAFRAGWTNLKLYFMIGLPTETEKDVRGIAALARAVLAVGEEVLPPRQKGRLGVTVSVASFVPKAHTPFQWEAQDRVEVLAAKQELLKEILRPNKRIRLEWHDPAMSFLEAVLARGDRRLARVLQVVAEQGGRLEAWSEGFDFSRWEAAFAACDLDPGFYANRRRADEEIFPWSHLQTGVSLEFLRAERERAWRGERTTDCRQNCTGCGVCPTLGVQMALSGGDTSEPAGE